MTPTIKAKDFMLRQFKKGDETSLRQHINHKDIYRNTLRIPTPYTPKPLWAALPHKSNFKLTSGADS